MLKWTLGFFVLALVAAFFAFAGAAVAATQIAKIVFFVFMILFFASLLGHLHRPHVK